MKKKLFAFLVLTLIIISAKAQDDKPYHVTYMNNPAPGYYYMSPYLSGIFNLTDNPGELVFNKNIGSVDVLFNPDLEVNGMISFYSNQKYYLINKNFELVDSFTCVGNYELDFHDFILLPNGNVIVLGRESRFVDLSKTVPGGNPNAIVIGNVIQELDRNKNVVFQWNTFDHFLITDETSDINLTQPSIIFCSINSMFYDYTDSNLIISSRFLDELTKIDMKTGDIIWRLGGKECKNNQFRFLNDTIEDFYGFSHQHSVTRLPNGNILLYDNGNLKPTPYSRAVEYKIDEKNKTVEKVWEYAPFPDVFSQAMGSAQRLTNGNTLIGWGINSRNLTATEVKPDGTKALEMDGYQNYAIYKNLFLSHAVTLDVSNPGIYNFNKDTNLTNVKMLVTYLNGTGNISVEKHFYQPHNQEFSLSFVPYIQNERWTVTSNGLINFYATVRFYIGYDTTNNPDDYHIFCREYEGKGSFTQLDTRYNSTEKCFEADIKGTGEFVVGIIPSVLAPNALFPPDSMKDVEVISTVMWQPLSMATKFRFQLSNLPDFSAALLDSSDITDTWLELKFNYNTTYYWRVKAFNGDEQSPWSKTFRFTTRLKDILSYPGLIYPTDGDSLIPLNGMLKWEKVKGALFYNVELGLDPDFAIPVLKRYNIFADSLSYNDLLPGRPHYWRVSSSNGNTESNWSPAWSFITENPSDVNFGFNSDKIDGLYNNGKIFFRINDKFTGSYNLFIYDIMGNLIGSSGGFKNENNSLQIDVNTFVSNPGIYLFLIKFDSGGITKKLFMLD